MERCEIQCRWRQTYGYRFDFLCIPLVNYQKDVDPFDKTRTYRDLDALINIVSQMLMMFVDEFVEVDGEPKLVPRLKVNLPVEPKSELFEK